MYACLLAQRFIKDAARAGLSLEDLTLSNYSPEK
jgi:hypothetical protein